MCTLRSTFCVVLVSLSVSPQGVWQWPGAPGSESRTHRQHPHHHTRPGAEPGMPVPQSHSDITKCIGVKYLGATLASYTGIPSLTALEKTQKDFTWYQATVMSHLPYLEETMLEFLIHIMYAGELGRCMTKTTYFSIQKDSHSFQWCHSGMV